MEKFAAMPPKILNVPMSDIKQIDYSGLTLDQVCMSLPRQQGRYIIYLDHKCISKAKEYFEYDKHRTPRHPHFEAYGKEVFDMDYIGHYLYPNGEGVSYFHPEFGLMLKAEIKP